MYDIMTAKNYCTMNEELNAPPTSAVMHGLKLIGFDLAKLAAKIFREDLHEISLPFYTHISEVGELCDDEFVFASLNNMLTECNMGIQLMKCRLGYKVIPCDTTGSMKSMEDFIASYKDLEIASSMKHDEDPISEAIDLILMYQVEGLKRGKTIWCSFDKLGKLLKNPTIREKVIDKVVEAGWDIEERNLIFKLVPLN